jgi:hypothetical protein
MCRLRHAGPEKRLVRQQALTFREHGAGLRAAQPPRDHAFVKTTESKAAAAARIGAGLGRRKFAELLELLHPCFAQVEPWLQAGRYAAAVISDLPRRNGWTLAERAGDRTPGGMQLPVVRRRHQRKAARRIAGTRLTEI